MHLILQWDQKMKWNCYCVIPFNTFSRTKHFEFSGVSNMYLVFMILNPVTLKKFAACVNSWE